VLLNSPPSSNSFEVAGIAFADLKADTVVPTFTATVLVPDIELISTLNVAVVLAMMLIPFRVIVMLDSLSSLSSSYIVS